MRWLERKSALELRKGELRNIEKFLWFPKCLRNPETNMREWRWLEKSIIYQRIEEVDVGGTCEWGNYAYYWCDVSWSEEK